MFSYRRRDSSGQCVTLFLAGWLLLAWLVGVAGWFRAATALAVAATVWVLTALALFATWKVNLFAAWARRVDLRWPVLFHSSRFVGFYFLLLSQRGELPRAFAIPAGIGDCVIAAWTFLLLALWRCGIGKLILLLWNTVGLIDITFVVVTALRIGLRDWQSMAALRKLPLSLLPTFLVPLIIASHLLIFWRIRKARGN